ncbi:TlpA disulfide reductase family protein [Agromyces seonyuensis]|uniref:Redoxin domain-containing protein n=1 Tax=Agromyces seonyuensis TaxID=2662446 RepID=A0A6I4NXF6_9MICO|nr:TlpA disulfide reductase family protein [Agromyces seonyuensis]MWB99010.1 redoxin domain-containing protein [Agromyces seonyuensis]
MSRTPALALAGSVALVLALAGCSSAEPTTAVLPTGAPEGVSFVGDPTAPPAPPVVGELLDGGEVDLAAIWADRPVVLQFTASWCDSCAEQQEELDELDAEWGERIAIVHINGDPEGADEDVRDFIDANDVAQPVLRDPELRIWRAYAVVEAPMTALIDTEGNLVRLWPLGADADVIESQLDSLVAR